MREDYLISVIVPIYNVADYVKECIESLIKQTYSNLEIILVDDGAADDSGEICEKYAKLDQRIVVYHKKNGGLSDARNYGIDRARGDLIAFVDGDDWIHPQMYEIMVSVMEQEHANVVTCWFEQENREFADEIVNIKKLNIKILTGAEALSDIETPLVVAWNKLYKKSIFEDIRYPIGKLHEDEFIIHKIFWKCNRIAVIDKPLYFYTVREGSIVAQMIPKRVYDALEAFDERVTFAIEKNWTEVMTAVVERYCDYTIDRYYEIKAGKHELLDASYLKLLWQSERDILMKYPDVYVDKKYKKFAISPTKYERWQQCRMKMGRYKNLIFYVVRRVFKRDANE